MRHRKSCDVGGKVHKPAIVLLTVSKENSWTLCICNAVKLRLTEPRLSEMPLKSQILKTRTGQNRNSREGTRELDYGQREVTTPQWRLVLNHHGVL
ncbi:hypothetical protein AVEN_88368-1 [Araneus ventricosus]|uniref:Uncharacterized protein n=1 Tax=Araneus ventricosus TaxID=182803 RepID=A0A4Y2IDM2_ARAVE|nr:hypothetical protein AVEN_88368-1 [Araneus ventricosus]